MLPKRVWMEMTWREVASADCSSWIVVLPLAAIEQHGPHLPLGTDTYIGEAYLTRVRALLPDGLPVTFLPIQPVGHSDEHTAFAGTLTLSAETMLATLRDIGASLHRAGVRKVVLANSHGGNIPVLDLAARELRVRHGMMAVTVSWHRFGYPDGLFAADESRHGIHAGAIETALMRAERPDLVRKEGLQVFPSLGEELASDFAMLDISRPASLAWMTQDLNASGAVGDATVSTAESGEAALQHGARAFVQLLEEVHRFDLARLREKPMP